MFSFVSSPQQAASGEAKENAVSRSLRNRLPAAVVTLLEQADPFEPLSLNPKFDMRPFKGSFHGYKVLAKTGVKDTKTRQRLISALLQGMRENSGNLAACFNPRHGIRSDGEQTFVTPRFFWIDTSPPGYLAQWPLASLLVGCTLASFRSSINSVWVPRRSQ